MAFKFRLQKILNLKEKAEENKKNEISVILREISNKEMQIENLNIERDEEIQNKERLNREGCIVNQIIDVNNFISYIDQSIEIATDELGALEAKLKQKQDEYLEVRKEKKSFEKLKEKDYEKYKVKLAKEEEKVVDQIVTFASSKKI